mgnify:FL=1
MSPVYNSIGVLLAGGLARRMGGGDKSLREVGERMILEWVVERSRPQVERLLLNANGDVTRFKHFGLPVVPDVLDGFVGPLAGVLSGLEWAIRSGCDVRWVVSFATDAPFIPVNMVERFEAVAVTTDSDIVCASSGGRRHPVFALWPVTIAKDLRKALVYEKVRKIDRFTANYNVQSVEFVTDPIDPFFNVNDPDSLERANILCRQL